MSFFFFRAVETEIMGNILTSMSGLICSLIFFVKDWRTISGQCSGSLSSLTYYSSFQEDLVIVSGQYLGSFSHFGAVFGQYLGKKDRLDFPIGLF